MASTFESMYYVFVKSQTAVKQLVYDNEFVSSQLKLSNYVQWLNVFDTSVSSYLIIRWESENQ